MGIAWTDGAGAEFTAVGGIAIAWCIILTTGHRALHMTRLIPALIDPIALANWWIVTPARFTTTFTSNGVTFTFPGARGVLARTRRAEPTIITNTIFTITGWTFGIGVGAQGTTFIPRTGGGDTFTSLVGEGCGHVAQTPSIRVTFGIFWAFCIGTFTFGPVPTRLVMTRTGFKITAFRTVL